MPTFIYSQHYFSEDFFTLSSPAILRFKRKKDKEISEDSFIEKAIFLSKKEKISLDIINGDDRMSADFIMKSLVLSKESTTLFERLVRGADMIEIIINRGDSPTTRLRLGRYRQQKIRS